MVPLWLKLIYTLVALAIVVIYWRKLGPSNLLWFSDIALILTIPALWLESAFLASTLAVLVLVSETVWILAYFIRLATGCRLGGLLDYMFDRDRPAWLRALSLFHIPLPILLIWLVWTLGYDPRALVAATLLGWLIMPLSRALTNPEQNINWVYGLGADHPAHSRLGAWQLVGLLMLGPPVVFYLPAHAVMMALI
jgi:hypothetical protein